MIKTFIKWLLKQGVSRSKKGIALSGFTYFIRSTKQKSW